MRSTLLAQAVIGLIAAATTDAASLQQKAAPCAQLPAGSGPKPDPDTVSAFLSLPAFSNAANGASTPKGYVKQYGNLQGASIVTNQYLGVALLTSYDVNACSAKCNAIKGCNSFNLYHERDPSQEPGTGNTCANPCSTTNIKCAFFSGSVSASDATNKGQFRNKFHVVIAGSNGYTNGLYLVSQAAREIEQPSNSAQSYCSSILGYTTPVVTTTVVATYTPRTTTSTTGTQIILATNTILVASTSTITQTASSTTTLILPTTTTATETDSATITLTTLTTTTEPYTFSTMTVTLSFPTTTLTTTTTTAPAATFTKRAIAPMTTINGVVALALPPAIAISGVQKRALSLPSVLSKYPGSIITSACSLAVTPVTKTSVVIQTSTSIASTLFITEVSSTTTATTADAFTSTTISTTTSTTETETLTTSSTVTVSATTVKTQTDVSVQTITAMVPTVVNTVVSTTPVITSVVTTTTTSPPLCTQTNYIFQIVGGTYNGQYVTADAPNPAAVSYGFVKAVSGVTNAKSFTIRGDGRVYDSTDVYGWTTRNIELDYILDMTDRSLAVYTSSRSLSCAIQSSASASSVAGAKGALSCRTSSDGSATEFATCDRTGDNIAQATEATVATTTDCTTITLVAIPNGITVTSC